MSLLLELFITFAKTGLFTFGGGYAMIALIEDTCVEKKKWITHDEMMSLTVIAESTPGPVAINCATYVGYKQKGIMGAVAATIGMILPSFVIIYLITGFLDRFLEIWWVARAFAGIKIAVGILIVDAAIKLIKHMKKNLLSILILAGAFIFVMLINLFSVSFSSVTLILLSAVIGICAYLIGNLSEGKKSK
ncbi:MAG: chromate transporter [Butyrivibrio sp.]|nr:chromate transporter [Butyrivibrio sp.]